MSQQILFPIPISIPNRLSAAQAVWNQLPPDSRGQLARLLAQMLIPALVANQHREGQTDEKI